MRMLLPGLAVMCVLLTGRAAAESWTCTYHVVGPQAPANEGNEWTLTFGVGRYTLTGIQVIGGDPFQIVTNDAYRLVAVSAGYDIVFDGPPGAPSIPNAQTILINKRDGRFTQQSTHAPWTGNEMAFAGHCERH